MNLFDYAESVKARDIALVSVVASQRKWMARALDVIESLPQGWSGIGEDIRMLVSEQIEPPDHHNSWGALILGAQKRNILMRNGELRSMSSRSSHARTSPVLVRV